jgi:UDP-glucose 4-epimerase
MNTALITGGAGFIGSHVADRFLAEGWTVHVVDSLVTGRRENVPAAATFHERDIRDEEVGALIVRLKPDVLVHLAAQMDVRKSVAGPLFDAQTNIVGTLTLLDAVLRGSPETRVVVASTGGALYGDYATPPHAETATKNPDSPYGIAKLSIELYVAYYARVHGLDTVVLRYGNVYGPRQDPHGEAGVVGIFCGRLLEEQPITVYGDGTGTRDYVYVSDAVEATWRVATGSLPPQALLDSRAYNVGSGVGTPMRRLLDALLSVSGKTVPVSYAPRRVGEQQDSYLEVAKAAAELDWRPVVALEEGLGMSFDWYAARHAAQQIPTRA